MRKILKFDQCSVKDPSSPFMYITPVDVFFKFMAFKTDIKFKVSSRFCKYLRKYDIIGHVTYLIIAALNIYGI